MKNNIYNQYDKVIDFLSDYYKFEFNITIRMMNPYKSILVQFRLGFKKYFFNTFGKGRDFLMTKRPDFFNEIIKELAKPEEILNPKFKIIFSQYPIESISQELESTYPDLNFTKIKKIHDLLKAKRNNISKFVTNIPSVILGLSSLMLNTIPKPVVESFQYNYIEFQIYVFWITFCVFAYFGFAIGVGLIIDTKIEIRSNYINDVLEYIVIKHEKESG